MWGTLAHQQVISGALSGGKTMDDYPDLVGRGFYAHPGTAGPFDTGTRATFLLVVSGSFLYELHPRADAELVVDVGEMALYGARRDEQPRGDVVVGQPFAD